jgi:hypothetical protein
MQPQPKWLKLGEEFLGPLIGMGLATLQQVRTSDPDLSMIPNLALLHFAHCLETSMEANRAGKHSVAICLVRHCIETLTLIDVGLQNDAFAKPLLASWKNGTTSGNLRVRLEKDIWPRYGNGLWDESWAEYFGNLARAVQPYAHYTHELQGWQLAVISRDFFESSEYTALTGLRTYDSLKASRITLFHGLVVWTLGRLLLAHGGNRDVLDRAQQIEEWGHALGSSNLLFKRKDWGVELLADMFFRPGVDWRDP